MKILLAIDCLGSGGAQRQMVYLARGLVDRGHAVTLFQYYPEHDFFGDVLKSANVNVVSLQKRRRFDLRPMAALRRLLDQGGFAAAVAFLFTPSLYLIGAKSLGARTPIIVSHRRSYEADGIPFGDRLRLTAYSRAGLIVCNSHRGSGEIARGLPFLSRKLRVVPNAVDLEAFVPPSNVTVASHTRLLFVGRLSPEKNLIRTIEALAMLRARGEQIPQISWIGRYDGGAAVQHAAELRARIEALGLADQWQPLGERQDVPEQMRSCDAVLLPSTFEGMPNAVCEGLAAGRPILASRVGDIEHLVQHGVSGYLFDPMDVRDIAENISKFMKMSPTERFAMGKAGRKFAERAFSIGSYIDNWENCIRSVAT